MTNSSSWFDTSKEGLAKLMEGKGKVFVLNELIANVWDTNSPSVEVSLVKLDGRPFAELIVKDEHPEGFANLTHAFTIFAESDKKTDAEKHGFLNLGEKLALSVCREASITTTSGSVHFDANGRTHKRVKTEKGSIFRGQLRMNQEEYDEVCKAVRRLLPPSRVRTIFNDEVIPSRTPLAVFEATLPTMVSDAEGVMRKVRRSTQVEVYEPLEGEPPTIYGLGIPVVELKDGDRYSVNVKQKIPLSMERDNVAPTYLRELRSLVLEAVAKKLSTETAREGWVMDALSQPGMAVEVIQTALEKKFEKPIDKIAIFDPSDPQANNTLIAEGFAVVAGGSLPKAVWENVKRTEAIRPSGQIRPTYDPNKVTTTTLVPRDQWSPAMVWVAQLAKRLANDLLNIGLSVNMRKGECSDLASYRASGGGITRWLDDEDRVYGPNGSLNFFLDVLPSGFFEGPLEDILDLLVHEFGHEISGNHLSADYYNALTKLAGKLAVLAYNNDRLFKDRP